jgi:hypothetical protein
MNTLDAAERQETASQATVPPLQGSPQSGGGAPVTAASSPSRTLLAILACGADNARLRRHWPYFKKTGFSILGCGTSDGTVSWPEAVPELSIGEIGRTNNAAGEVIFGLVKHELEIIYHFLLVLNDFDTLMIAEADNLFVCQPPPHPQNGLYLAPTIPNYAPAGLFKTPVYFTTPRVMDRQCASAFEAHGRGMFQRGDVEHFVSDRFPAAVCHQGRIPWMHYPGWSPLPMTWSVTGLLSNDSRWVRDARTAIQLGACCLHSVKHDWQLDAVKDLIWNP